MESLYGQAADAFEEAEEDIGMSLTELLEIPNGEICFALVSQPDGPPVFVGLVEVGDQLENAEKLIALGEADLGEEGAERSTDQVGETELVIHNRTNGEGPVIHFVHEGVIGVVSNVDVAVQVLERWKGQASEEDETLLDNRKFVTIMRKSAGTKEERPQISWYVDPIEIARVVSRGNFAAQTGLALLPALGLDGLKAIGGSVIVAPEEFDTISHLHVLLDNPRSGVIEMLAVKTGDSTPEPWVPADAGSYMTMHLDLDKAYNTMHELYDSIRGEGEFDKIVDSRINDRIQMSLKEQIIDNLDGRVTYASFITKPAKLNGVTHLVGVKLSNPDAFEGVLEDLLDLLPEQDRLKKGNIGGKSYYWMDVDRPERREAREARAEGGLGFRFPQPSFAIVGDYLLISDSQQFLEKAITSKGDASSLADELDFKLVLSKIKQHAGNNKPSMISFDRPEEGLRFLYDLATSDGAQSMLSGAAEDDDFFQGIKDAYDANPLPKFDKLQQYLAPSGSMLISDETGFHIIGFSMKRN